MWAIFNFFTVRSSCTSKISYTMMIQIWFTDDITVESFLNLFFLGFNLTIWSKNNSFIFICLVWSLSCLYSSIFIFLRHLTKLSKNKVVGHKCYMFDAIFRCFSFFCKNRELSATVSWSDYEPCATFIELLSLWLSSNRDKRCCSWHLFDFDSF